jgi:hypothetical protein
VVEHLRALGHDVLTAGEAGNAGQAIHVAVAGNGDASGRLIRVNRPPPG